MWNPFRRRRPRATLALILERLEPMSQISQDLDTLKAAVAAQKDLLAAQTTLITGQGTLLTRAIATLDDLAAKAAGSSDPAIAQLAADISANNDAIRAESAELAAQGTAVSAELDKVAPTTQPPPAPAA